MVGILLGTLGRVAGVRERWSYGGNPGHPSVHCWLLPPLQDHRSASAPLAVLAPVTSRQSPDCTPVTVPSALSVHCWLAAPLQAQMTALVPLAVPCPLASRHSVVPLTVSVSWWEAVWVQFCAAAPLQLKICIWVPAVLTPFGSSRHLPAPTACSGLVAVPLPP